MSEVAEKVLRNRFILINEANKEDLEIYQKTMSSLVPVMKNGKLIKPCFTDEYIAAACGFQRNIQERVNQIKKVALYLTRCTWRRTYQNNGGSFITLDLLNRVIGVKVPNAMAMYRLIDNLEKCGVIYCSNPRYRFNSTENFSRMYHVNSLFIFEGQQKQAQINIEHKQFDFKDLFKQYDTRTPIGDVFPFNMIRLNQKKEYEHNFLKDDLYKYTCGTVDDFKVKLDYINGNEAEINRKEMFFNYDKRKGYNGRAYSQYIGTRKEEDDLGNFIETDRTLWRKANNLRFKYDIRGAVPRCLYLMKTNKWLDGNVDPYKMIWDDYVKRTGSTFEYDRTFLKQAFMRCAFSQSRKMAIAQFNRAVQQKAGYVSYDDELTQMVNDVLGGIWDSIDNVFGHDFVKQVFYIESYIELMVCYNLKRQGIKCYNIYDEFYYTKDIDIEKEIEDAAYYVAQAFHDYSGELRYRAK